MGGKTHYQMITLVEWLARVLTRWRWARLSRPFRVTHAPKGQFKDL